MMRHVCMASLQLLSSVHTGGPSSKALTRIDVMQEQFLQLCCFYSIHRVSDHACLYGIVYMGNLTKFKLESCDFFPNPSVHSRTEYLPLLWFALE